MKILHALTCLLLVVGCILLGGTAQAQLICTADYTPVCATNGQTYSNMCRLRGSGAKLAHNGACKGG